MILNVTGTGAGTAAVPHFQSLVKRAETAGITVDPASQRLKRLPAIPLK